MTTTRISKTKRIEGEVHAAFAAALDLLDDRPGENIRPYVELQPWVAIYDDDTSTNYYDVTVNWRTSDDDATDDDEENYDSDNTD